MRIMAKTAAQTRNASKAPLSLKVTLYGTKPPVWRRLLIPGEMTLGDLHQAIQAAMGWDGGHLHAFDIAGRQYGDPDSLDEVADEERLTLNKVLNTGVSRFTYTYDFGDNWEHTVLIERPRQQGSRIRVCSPMPGVVTETSGLPVPLTEPAKDETSAQTAGLF